MKQRKFSKILIANRGEIAIRLCRACNELNIKTVAVYSYEDLLAIHRYKADEAYQIGEPGKPIAAYLDQEAILRVAKDTGADAVHPGYGFLSENADFARLLRKNGIEFIGPHADTIDMLGDKTKAREIAIKEKVPVIPGLDEAAPDLQTVLDFADKASYPVILKAAFGGGGRGMRIVKSKEDMEDAFNAASSEAKSAFGRGELFCEKYLPSAKHIEIQILADKFGNRMHLYERDCSIQRRHQKIVEFAPSLSVKPEVLENMYADALKIAKATSYENAGTVEFLVTPDGSYYFIEVNPRLQVEHTVTECITGIDLVHSQIRIAEGFKLSDDELEIPAQEKLPKNGFAIQSRITTEDPSLNFAPDTGKIKAYRSAAGFGIRLDAGTGGSGTVISPFYDSLIVKVTAHAQSFNKATLKMLRSLREFRIRGVKTNIPFLENAISHPLFLSGQTDTRFIDTSPELMKFKPRKDRASKILSTLAEITVNGPIDFDDKLIEPDNLSEISNSFCSSDLTQNSEAMECFKQNGASGLSKWLYDQKKVMITDTTMRDAHQSLLATRMRSYDLFKIAPATAQLAKDLFSLEMWGGATFDVAYRFLKESPWERLEHLKTQIPNLLFQMLIRGSNAVGYTNYPDNVLKKFVKKSAELGIDIFRIFDCLNYLPNMEFLIDEVGKTGKIVESTICYTGDLSDPSRTKYNLKYYVDLAKKMEARGAHILGIKDMAGLIKPKAATMLISTLKKEVGIPLHLHTHDTSGNGISMYMAAIDAGVDAIDVALSSMSGLTSQPSLNSLLSILEGHDRDPGLNIKNHQQLSDQWEKIRKYYKPFESGLLSSTADVYRHEIPGGQYSNLKARAEKIGLSDKFNLIKDRYAEVNKALGDVIKVTPSSKVVADFAMFLVNNNYDVEQAVNNAENIDFPDSLINFLKGGLGQPYGGFPEKLSSAVLKGEKASIKKEILPDFDFDAAKAALEQEFGIKFSETDLISYALYPEVFKNYVRISLIKGNLSVLPTKVFLYGLKIGEQICVDIEPGKTLVIKLVAIGGLTHDEKRVVYFELNGRTREVQIDDNSINKEVSLRPKADPGNKKHIAASLPGKVIKIFSKVNDEVNSSQVLLTTEAMKMETSLSAGIDSKIKSILVKEGDEVQSGDLLVELE